MAITYENGNIGDNATDANAPSMSISLGGMLTSSDVYFAVLVGWSTSSNFTSVTQTNVTWTYLTNWVNSTTGCEVELWVGFATSTPGTTVSVVNSVSCYLVGTVSRWQGFVSQPVMVRGVYYGAGNLPSSFPENTNQTVITGINCNAGDAILACLWWGSSAAMNSSLSASLGGTYYSQTFVGWSPTGQTDQGWAAEVATSAVSNFSIRMDDISGAITGSPPYFGIIFVLKGALGGDSYNENFSDPLPITETIAKKTARSNLSDPFTGVFADTFVQHRLLPGETFGETVSFQDLGIVKNPAKSPKDPFTITESFLATQSIASATFSDSFTLVESISKKISRSTFLDAYTMVESMSSSLGVPVSTTGTISYVQAFSNTTSAAGSSITVSLSGLTANAVFVIQVFWAYKTSGATSVSSIALTGATNFARLSALSTYNSASGNMYVVEEVWIGYATSSIATSGTMTITLNASNSTGIGAFVYQFTGITASGALENAYTTSTLGGTSSGTNQATVTGVVVATAGDLEFMAVAGQYDVASSGTLEPDPPSSAPSVFTGFNQTSSGGAGGGCAFRITTTSYASHADTMGVQQSEYNAFSGIVVILTAAPISGANFNANLSDPFNVTEAISKKTARAFAAETGIYSVFADVITTNHGHVPPTLSDSFTSVFADAVSKKPGKLPVDPFSVVESFSQAHTHAPGSFSDPFTLLDTIQKATARGAVADQFSLLEPTFSTTHGYFPPALTDTFSMADVFATLQLHFLSELDTFTLSDNSSRTHNQKPNLSDTINLSDIFGKSHAQFASLADALTLLETISTVHAYREGFLDAITILEAFLKTSSGGGVLLLYATGTLLGSSTASAFIAAWVYAAASGHGYAAARVSISFLIAAMLKGASLLAGLAGQEFTDTGAASGASSVTGIEGARLMVATGSTEGDGSIGSDTSLWTAPTGEADGASPEMDCDTQCIFCAEGNTMSDTPGSAVAVATYAFLHMIATLRGASLAVAQAHSPVVASGSCEGESTAEYVNVALYDAEAIGGESEAIGMAGGFFHAVGECNPIMASNARGTANYGPGQIDALVRGRGVVAAAPTLLVM